MRTKGAKDLHPRKKRAKLHLLPTPCLRPGHLTYKDACQHIFNIALMQEPRNLFIHLKAFRDMFNL